VIGRFFRQLVIVVVLSLYGVRLTLTLILLLLEKGMWGCVWIEGWKGIGVLLLMCTPNVISLQREGCGPSLSR
jgi:hypothetical protein